MTTMYAFKLTLYAAALSSLFLQTTLAKTQTTTYKVVAQRGAVVRQDRTVTSNKVTTLAQGTIITVSRTHGRRLKLVSPVRGWCSERSASGKAICEMMSREAIADSKKLTRREKQILRLRRKPVD